MGVRHVLLIALVLLLLASLTACSGSCPPTSSKSYETRDITEKVDIYADEPYITQETRTIGKKCIERNFTELDDSRFNISISPAEWLDPPVPGLTNNIRRTIIIFNPRDVVDAIYLDKVYLYGGVETKRSKTPLMFLVDPKASRTLYVMWDTQYDPLKDVTVALTNNTEYLGLQTTTLSFCYNETEKFNITKHEKVFKGSREELKGQEKIVKVKLNRNC
jgi:hypothetical protein